MKFIYYNRNTYLELLKLTLLFERQLDTHKHTHTSKSKQTNTDDINFTPIQMWEQLTHKSHTISTVFNLIVFEETN